MSKRKTKIPVYTYFERDIAVFNEFLNCTCTSFVIDLFKLACR